MSGFRLARWIATVAVAMAMAMAAGAAPARADTSTCTHALILGVGVVALSVTDTGPFDPQGIAVVGNELRKDNDGLATQSCDGATLQNTDVIVITDSSPSPTASVDPILTALIGGPFAPGMINETGGSDEIEISADLGGGSDVLTYSSRNLATTVRVGRNGGDRVANLNAFEPDGLDSDLTMEGVDELRVLAGSPADLSGAGGQATGGPTDQRLYLSGSKGNDKLIGGPASDRLFGGGGKDEQQGAGGRDKLFGDVGPDKLRGGPGADHLYGDQSDDLLSGGRGKDVCRGGPGDDTFKGCEKILDP